MAFKISYNITAIDKFSGVLKKIRKNFDDLNKKVSGSGGVFKNANSEANSFSRLLNKIKNSSNSVINKLRLISTSLKTRQPSAFNRMLQNIGNTAAVASGKIGKMIGHLKPKGYGDLGIKAGVAGAVGFGIKEASDIQAEEMRLSGLVGGHKKAVEAMDNIRSMAINTTQNMEGLIDSFHSFESVGMSTAESFKRLKQSADIAAFAKTDTKELSRIFTDVKEKGKASMESFMVLKDKRVALMKELARERHLAFDTDADRMRISALIESGAVRAKEYFKLIDNMEKHEKLEGFSERITLTPMGQMSKIWASIKDVITSVGEILGNTIMPILVPMANKMAEFAAWMRDVKNTAGTGLGITMWIGVIGLFTGKLLAAFTLLKGIRGIFMGTTTVMEVLVSTAKAFVSPFKTLWQFLGKIFGFMTKIVKVAATFGLGAAKKAGEIIKPAASKVAISGVGRKIGASLATATAANPLVDIAASIIIPDVAGDATRNLKHIDKTPIAKGLLSANNADLTALKAQSFISALVNQSTGLANAENINKSHVKIEFEGKDAKINAIKQKDDSKNTFFDMSALGFNTFRGAY